MKILLFSFPVLLVVGCERVSLFTRSLKQTPHESYSEALAEAALDESELGRRWLSAAESALTNSFSIELPYEEVGWLTPEEVQAFGWQFPVRKGQRLVVELETPPENSGAIFIDLFILEHGSDVEHVTSLDKDKWRLDHSVEKDANYLLRLQPELLTGGRYELKVTLLPSLAFPVEGKDSAAIRSFFGDPRDGGSREHHGVDIFAPRGTKVLAAAGGVVFQTGVTPRGGKVVWFVDRNFNRSYYYAHLNEIFVRQGERVRSGEPLGSVGNTGNARSTPPHLHFGIYEHLKGPVNPFPFIHSPDGLDGQTQVADRELKSVLSVKASNLRLRESPSTKAPVLAELGRHTIVRAVAKTGDWYRTALADGLQGYVSAEYIQAVKSPIKEIKLTETHLARSKPTASAPEVGRIAAGKEVELYGHLDDFQYVKLPSGHFGWIAVDWDR